MPAVDVQDDARDELCGREVVDRRAHVRGFANAFQGQRSRRVGEPADMGAAIHYLASAPFVTGVVLDVDGGHGVRQYADAATDPMRRGDR